MLRGVTVVFCLKFTNQKFDLHLFEIFSSLVALLNILIENSLQLLKLATPQASILGSLLFVIYISDKSSLSRTNARLMSYERCRGFVRLI